MIDQVHPRDLPAWLQAASAHGEPLVLDVRESFEVRMASIRPDGFAFMAIPMATIPTRLHEIDPNRPIACLCHHGGRSMQVAAFLTQHGFAHVANIAGGIDAWSRDVDTSIPRY
jgi:rhodanese-related sulfurtransferase